MAGLGRVRDRCRSRPSPALLIDRAVDDHRLILPRPRSTGGVVMPSWRPMVDLPAPPAITFASDNAAGVHPAVMDALAAVNHGHALAYGDDPWTRQLGDVMRDVFGAPVETLPVWGGTGANVVALACLTHASDAVVCADTAHIHTDEAGAPERMAGTKLRGVARDRRQAAPRATAGPRRVARRRAPPATEGAVDHAVDGVGDALHHRRDRRAVRRSAPARNARASRRCRGSRTRRRRSAATCARSRSTWASTSSRSVARRTGSCTARRWCSAGPSWRPEPRTCASSSRSCRRKCATSPRSSSRSSPTACGCDWPSTPTPWRRSSRRPWPQCPAPRWRVRRP